MYRQHFGLKYPPLGKDIPELWDDGALAQLKERFQWLLESPGVGLLTGEAGVVSQIISPAVSQVISRQVRPGFPH